MPDEDRISIAMPEGWKNIIQIVARRDKKSVNRWICEAILAHSSEYHRTLYPPLRPLGRPKKTDSEE